MIANIFNLFTLFDAIHFFIDEDIDFQGSCRVDLLRIWSNIADEVSPNDAHLRSYPADIDSTQQNWTLIFFLLLFWLLDEDEDSPSIFAPVIVREDSSSWSHIVRRTVLCLSG